MKKIYNFIIVLLLLFSSCLGDIISYGFNRDNWIVVNNKTDEDFYGIESVLYPDSSLDFTTKRSITEGNHKALFIPKQKINQIGWGEYCDKRDWKHIDSDTLILFIIKANALDTLDWTMDNYHKLVYRRYFLSYDDLMARQCTVTVE